MRPTPSLPSHLQRTAIYLYYTRMYVYSKSRVRIYLGTIPTDRVYFHLRMTMKKNMKRWKNSNFRHIIFFLSYVHMYYVYVRMWFARIISFQCTYIYKAIHLYIYCIPCMYVCIYLYI